MMWLIVGAVIVAQSVRVVRAFRRANAMIRTAQAEFGVPWE